ncbi:MAG: hypothetical protein O8C61_06490 [Candidatus Methanoperedens sp.]|nr:hypothetical protein [Candidatus Methanoperedens sp.]
MNKPHISNRMNIRKFERFGEIRNKARILDGEKLAIKGDLK